MAGKRDWTVVYIMFAQALLGVEPYDAKGAFVLLNSIAEGLGDETPAMIDLASHLHMVAALGDDEAARRDARRSLVRLIAVLEHKLMSDASA